MLDWSLASEQNAAMAISYPVIVGTTNRPSEVDASFRRGGRMEVEIDLINFGVEDRHRYARAEM